VRQSPGPSQFGWQNVISFSQWSPRLCYRRKSGSPVSTDPAEESAPLLPADREPSDPLPATDTIKTFNLSIILVICTLGFFDFTMEGYKKLFTIYLSTSRPIGKGMDPEQLGYAFGGSICASIAIVAICFQKVERSFGAMACYRVGLLAFCASWFITPFIGFGGGQFSLWVGIVGMLILRGVTSFTAITCALLLVPSFSICLLIMRSPNSRLQNLFWGY
jgi:hypothetical protein